MKKYILLIFTLFFFAGAQAQTRYLVKFKDKGTNPFSLANPSQYLSTRGILRRTRFNIAIDSLDLPVTPRYVDSVRLAGAVTILNTSKWLNEVAIRTTDNAALAHIATLPFVSSVTAIAAFSSTNTPVNKQMEHVTGPDLPQDNSFINDIQADFYNYGRSHGQVHLNRADFLHNHGFRGENMQIGILDAGFFHYQTLPTFDSIRINNQILNTYDFVANETSVNEDDTHGEECLSTMAANMPGLFVGTAPKAVYCLYRTEDVATENKIEEHNLAAGFERADSIGVDVCSVSLGYNQFDITSQSYTYADMNGNTTLSSKAADLAAKKGMLPVVAAGNEGNTAWHFIVTPGDADSVITVGAVDTLRNIASFSSYGPSSDGRVKPELAACGLNAVIANPNTGQPVFGNGTSFATPNLAGMTTCLWQAFPEFNNMIIRDAMIRSGSTYTAPGTRIGYGIADMEKAFIILLRRSYTQQATVANCTASLQFNIKYDNSMNIVVERKLASESSYTTVQTIPGTGSFTNKTVNVSDDLTALVGGPALYRVRMDIAADTSFFLDSISVNFTPKPALGADKSVAVCNAAPFDLTTQYAVTGLTTAYSINGTPVANPQAVTAAGAYRLMATNASGCSDTAFINLSIASQLNIGGDQTVLKCSSATSDLTGLYNTSGLTVSWTNAGIAVADPSMVPAGLYRLVVSNSSGCRDTAFVTVSDDPQSCPSNSITLNPNPVIGTANLSISRTAATRISIVMVNSSGQRVYDRTYQQAAGTQVTAIDMQKMSRGVYYLTVLGDDKKITTIRLFKK